MPKDHGQAPKDNDSKGYLVRDSVAFPYLSGFSLLHPFGFS